MYLCMYMLISIDKRNKNITKESCCETKCVRDADCSNVSQEIGQLYLIHLSRSRNHEFTYGTHVERDQSSITQIRSIV